ncbi:Uncharacterized protein SCF082_LOCUS48070 [Durusdinium trenchii]|uniref:Uncharacterized protein n=2 Tax=Durusdinium trenchii TaxID=1381693 RepID=A0ABP0RQH5_9DINO
MLAGVRPGWPDPSAEAVLSDASSRSSDSNYLDQGQSAKRPVRPLRPPRPALLRSLEEQRTDARAVAEEHGSILFGHSKASSSMSRSWEDTKLPSHPIRADPNLKVEKMPTPARRAEVTRKAVKAGVPAIGTLVQEQLQMKYGLSLDIDDFVRKVESLCRAQLNGDDWDPLQIVSCLNGIKDMRFRTRDAARILELRLEPRSTESFQSLAEEVHSTLGTSSAVAVVINPSGGPRAAVAVFREDYAHPQSALVGRCADLSSEPLITFTSGQLDYALMLGVSIAEVLRLEGEAEASPSLRAEYLSLKGLKAEEPKLDLNPPVEQHGRQGLADALLERRAAEASQPSVVSMAMDWLWSGGRSSSWMSASHRPARTGTSAPPSQGRHSVQSTVGEAKLNLKVPRKTSPTGRFGYSPGRFSHRSSSRPGARAMETPAPLLMAAAGPGPATLSRADSPETPPAARCLRKDEAMWEQDPVSKDLVIEDPPHRRREVSRTSATWGFCS